MAMNSFGIVGQTRLTSTKSFEVRRFQRQILKMCWKYGRKYIFKKIKKGYYTGSSEPWDLCTTQGKCEILVWQIHFLHDWYSWPLGIPVVCFPAGLYWKADRRNKEQYKRNASWRWLTRQSGTHRLVNPKMMRAGFLVAPISDKPIFIASKNFPSLLHTRIGMCKQATSNLFGGLQLRTITIGSCPERS
jgi:hypothetical protein